MSRFKSIRNKINKNSSMSVDEKLSALDKELEKTGMSNVSEMMTTDNVLSSSEYVPPQDRIEGDVPNSSGIGGDGFTQSSAGSGTEGHAPSYSSLSDLFNSTVNHPIFQTPSSNNVPVSFGVVQWSGSGAGTNYGIIEEGNIIRGVLGGFVAGGTRPASYYVNIYESYLATNQHSPGYFSDEQIEEKRVSAELATQVENIRIEAAKQGLEFIIPWQGYRSPNMFVDSQPYGTSYTHPTKGLLILAGFNLLGMPNRYTIQEPKPPGTTDPIRRGLEDPPIYPGRIPPGMDPKMSEAAYAELKRRAEEAAKNKKGEQDKGENDEGDEDDQEEFDAEREKLYKENIRKLAQLLRMSEKEFMRKAEALGYMTYLRNILYAKDPAALKIAHKFMVSQYHGLSKIIGQITGLKTAANMLVTYDRYIGSGSTAPLDVTNQVDRGSMVKLMRAVQKAKQSSKYKSYQKSLAKIDSGESKANRNDVLDLMRDAVRESLQKTTKPDVSIGGFNIGKFLNPNLQQTFHNNVQVDKKVFDKSGGKKIVLTKTYKFNPGSSVATAEKTWWGKLLTAGGVELDRMGVGAYAVPALIASYLTLKNVGVKHGGKAYNARGMPMRVKIPDVRVETYELESQMLTEDVALGHFEPQELYIDIEKLKKGIMPEFPKKAPAKMIGGYHQDSKLKPKEFKDKYLLKIDEKDLLRNHRLKKGEADEMMNTIKMINDYLSKHPEDLIYVQQRYPVDDPRLAELNYKMDMMLGASKEYMDSNFKENKKLFKRATEHTLKNIKLTDPKYVQQKYDELRGTPKPKRSINKRNVSRFFKKPVNKKSSMEEIDDKIKQLDKDLLL